MILLEHNIYHPFKNHLVCLAISLYCKVKDPKLMTIYIILQSSQEHFCEFPSLASSWPPNSIKAIMSHDILGDSNRIIQINDSMPKTPWNKHCLSRSLDKLYDFQLLSTIFLLNFWQNLNEIVNRFILIFSISKFLAFYDRFRHLWGKKHPSFMTDKWGIPCWCHKWVCMYSGTRSLGSHYEPELYIKSNHLYGGLFFSPACLNRSSLKYGGTV